MESMITNAIWTFEVVVAAELFCLHVFYDRLRFPWRRLILCILPIACVAAVIEAFLVPVLNNLGNVLVLLLLLVVGVFALRVVTSEPIGIVLFVLYLAAHVQYICQSVTWFVYALWFPAMLEGDYTWPDIISFGLPILLLTPLFAVAGRHVYRNLQRVSSKQFARMWLLPLLFLLLNLLQVIFYPIDKFAAEGVKIMIGLCAFLTYSQMASAVSNAARAAQETAERAQMAHQLDLQRARMEDLESHAEEMKRIRHDRRQHVHVLRGLLEKKAVDEALTYLDDYDNSMAEAIQPPLCDNFVADTLCRRYETLAKQAGIEVTLALSLPKEPGIAGNDLAIVLGNLWENAVAAALDAQGERRFIRLRVQPAADKVLIRMENGYGGTIVQEDGRLLSTKPGREQAEGIGTASVRAVAVRYGGMAEFTYTPETFTAAVMLCTQV